MVFVTMADDKNKLLHQGCIVTMSVFRIFLLSITALMVFPALAAKVSVEQGYVRATIPGTQVSSAYMVIKTNCSKR